MVVYSIYFAAQSYLQLFTSHLPFHPPAPLQTPSAFLAGGHPNWDSPGARDDRTHSSSIISLGLIHLPARLWFPCPHSSEVDIWWSHAPGRHRQQWGRSEYRQNQARAEPQVEWRLIDHDSPSAFLYLFSDHWISWNQNWRVPSFQVPLQGTSGSC